MCMLAQCGRAPRQVLDAAVNVYSASATLYMYVPLPPLEECRTLPGAEKVQTSILFIYQDDDYIYIYIYKCSF